MTATWPVNVTARYLTVGGATVDIYDVEDSASASVMCKGCLRCNPRWSNDRAWAQKHAATCRAMPKPKPGGE